MRLTDCKVLVVEDDFMLAQGIQWALEDAGAVVIGPVASVASALKRINEELMIDAAVLDVNLGGEISFPVADALSGRGIPFVFASGCEDDAATGRYPGVLRCIKPFTSGNLLKSLEVAIH